MHVAMGAQKAAMATTVVALAVISAGSMEGFTRGRLAASSPTRGPEPLQQRRRSRRQAVGGTASL